ncbi:MAG: hypothetical protein EB021_09495 [Gammaproteobacteria bacterium]|nr:hypothetical protein [Gammaproteobacteria bacterium]
MLDHIDRAELVYGDRIGVVDEPDQPAASWGTLTYARMAELARAQAAGLDALGIGVGERVAIVSHNSARLLTAFFGVSGSGRIIVPVNFRLSPAEIGYIVEHCGASMMLVDPELDDALAGIVPAHRYVLGTESDASSRNLGRTVVPIFGVARVGKQLVFDRLASPGLHHSGGGRPTGSRSLVERDGHRAALGALDLDGRVCSLRTHGIGRVRTERHRGRRHGIALVDDIGSRGEGGRLRSCERLRSGDDQQRRGGAKHENRFGIDEHVNSPLMFC